MTCIKYAVLTLLIILPCHSFAADNIRKISVTGKSETVVAAQYAIIKLNLKYVKKEMNQSHAELMKNITKLSNALAKIGLTEKDIKRSLVLQGPEHSLIRDTEVLKGYYSQCQIDLNVNDIGKMALVYKELANFKNLTIESTEFKRNDEFDIRKTEYEKALQAARKKAEYMTQALQAKMGKVHSIREFNLETGPDTIPATEAVAANISRRQREAYTSNEPVSEYGNIKITALVSVEFELE